MGEPSTSGWGAQFCTAHHVGYFCRGFTRVRCCRSTWGFQRCGTSVHYRGCGWRGYGYNEVQGDSNAAQLPETAAVDDEDAGVYPDETTGYDEVGPFLAVPDESEAENPKPAIAGWDNSTSLQAAAFHSWGRSFCRAPHVGLFCYQHSRVHCCNDHGHFVQCTTG